MIDKSVTRSRSKAPVEKVPADLDIALRIRETRAAQNRFVDAFRAAYARSLEPGREFDQLAEGYLSAQRAYTQARVARTITALRTRKMDSAFLPLNSFLASGLFIGWRETYDRSEMEELRLRLNQLDRAEQVALGWRQLREVDADDLFWWLAAHCRDLRAEIAPYQGLPSLHALPDLAEQAARLESEYEDWSSLQQRRVHSAAIYRNGGHVIRPSSYKNILECQQQLRHRLVLSTLVRGMIDAELFRFAAIPDDHRAITSLGAIKRWLAWPSADASPQIFQPGETYDLSHCIDGRLWETRDRNERRWTEQNDPPVVADRNEVCVISGVPEARASRQNHGGVPRIAIRLRDGMLGKGKIILNKNLSENGPMVEAPRLGKPTGIAASLPPGIHARVLTLNRQVVHATYFCIPIIPRDFSTRGIRNGWQYLLPQPNPPEIAEVVGGTPSIEGADLLQWDVFVDETPQWVILRQCVPSRLSYADLQRLNQAVIQILDENARSHGVTWRTAYQYLTTPPPEAQPPRDQARERQRERVASGHEADDLARLLQQIASRDRQENQERSAQWWFREP